MPLKSEQLAALERDGYFVARVEHKLHMLVRCCTNCATVEKAITLG